MRELEIHQPQLPYEFIREPQLDMVDIFAVQSLVMGYLLRRARTTRNDATERKYRLAMLDNETLGPDQVAYDGSHDTYLSCKVQKIRHDQWRMLVSFLETYNTEDTKSLNHRQTYLFDWLRNGNRQAWFTDTTRHRSDEGLYLKVNATHPITSEACLQLQDRMLAVSQAANPIETTSILIPNLQKNM